MCVGCVGGWGVGVCIVESVGFVFCLCVLSVYAVDMMFNKVPVPTPNHIFAPTHPPLTFPPHASLTYTPPPPTPPQDYVSEVSNRCAPPPTGINTPAKALHLAWLTDSVAAVALQNGSLVTLQLVGDAGNVRSIQLVCALVRYVVG